MKIAIYTRKSKYSDKSESIDSQIEYCKQSSKLRFPGVNDFQIYIDEGFSGGTTDRPQYKKLLEDIKTKQFTAVICYKIDRLSRSVADFANLQQYLKKYDVNIISASEGFDTSSIWGESVLNILMIFAQIERNNVSERVKDTMLHNAKQGRWTGGLTPLGFESKTITYDDALGQEKKMVILSPIPEEIDIIKLIYKKYAIEKSLNEVESYLVQNDIKTRKNNYFSVATIRNILINPVYAIADNDLYSFFKDKGADIYGDEKDFDGNFSVLPYNREDKKKSITRPTNEWIIAISRHIGIIPGKDWVQTQHILEYNSFKKPRKGTAKYGIFSGLIKCNECNSTMRIKNGRLNKDNVQEFYYVCSLKESSQCTKCNMKNLVGRKIEHQILSKLEDYAKDSEAWKEQLHKNDINISIEKNHTEIAIKNLKVELNNKESAISNLVKQISQTDDLTAGKYLINSIDNIDIEIKAIKEKLSVLNLKLQEESSTEKDFIYLKNILGNISSINKIDDVKLKRDLIKIIIKEMQWNGNTITIHFKTGESVYFNSFTEDAQLQTFHAHRESCGVIC